MKSIKITNNNPNFASIKENIHQLQKIKKDFPKTVDRIQNKGNWITISIELFEKIYKIKGAFSNEWILLKDEILKQKENIKDFIKEIKEYKNTDILNIIDSLINLLEDEYKDDNQEIHYYQELKKIFRNIFLDENNSPIEKLLDLKTFQISKLGMLINPYTSIFIKIKNKYDGIFDFQKQPSTGEATFHINYEKLSNTNLVPELGDMKNNYYYKKKKNGKYYKLLLVINIIYANFVDLLKEPVKKNKKYFEKNSETIDFYNKLVEITQDLSLFMILYYKTGDGIDNFKKDSNKYILNYCQFNQEGLKEYNKVIEFRKKMITMLDNLLKLVEDIYGFKPIPYTLGKDQKRYYITSFVPLLVYNNSLCDLYSFKNFTKTKKDGYEIDGERVRIEPEDYKRSVHGVGKVSDSPWKMPLENRKWYQGSSGIGPFGMINDLSRSGLEDNLNHNNITENNNLKNQCNIMPFCNYSNNWNGKCEIKTDEREEGEIKEHQSYCNNLSSQDLCDSSRTISKQGDIIPMCKYSKGSCNISCEAGNCEMCNENIDVKINGIKKNISKCALRDEKISSGMQITTKEVEEWKKKKESDKEKFDEERENLLKELIKIKTKEENTPKNCVYNKGFLNTDCSNKYEKLNSDNFIIDGTNYIEIKVPYNGDSGYWAFIISMAYSKKHAEKFNTVEMDPYILRKEILKYIEQNYTGVLELELKLVKKYIMLGINLGELGQPGNEYCIINDIILRILGSKYKVNFMIIDEKTKFIKNITNTDFLETIFFLLKKDFYKGVNYYTPLIDSHLMELGETPQEWNFSARMEKVFKVFDHFGRNIKCPSQEEINKIIKIKKKKEESLARYRHEHQDDDKNWSNYFKQKEGEIAKDEKTIQEYQSLLDNGCPSKEQIDKLSESAISIFKDGNDIEDKDDEIKKMVKNIMNTYLLELSSKNIENWTQKLEKKQIELDNNFTKLNGMKYTIEDSPKDGNCGYWAFIKSINKLLLLQGSSLDKEKKKALQNPLELRLYLYRLIKNKSRQDCVTDDFMKIMSIPDNGISPFHSILYGIVEQEENKPISYQSWMNHTVLILLSCIFNINIIIYYRDKNSGKLLHSILPKDSGKDVEEIIKNENTIILLNDNNHFKSLIPGSNVGGSLKKSKKKNKYNKKYKKNVNTIKRKKRKSTSKNVITNKIIKKFIASFKKNQGLLQKAGSYHPSIPSHLLQKPKISSDGEKKNKIKNILPSLAIMKATEEEIEAYEKYREEENIKRGKSKWSLSDKNQEGVLSFEQWNENRILDKYVNQLKIEQKTREESEREKHKNFLTMTKKLFDLKNMFSKISEDLYNEIYKIKVKILEKKHINNGTDYNTWIYELESKNLLKKISVLFENGIHRWVDNPKKKGKSQIRFRGVYIDEVLKLIQGKINLNNDRTLDSLIKAVQENIEKKKKARNIIVSGNDETNLKNENLPNLVNESGMIIETTLSPPFIQNDSKKIDNVLLETAVGINDAGPSSQVTYRKIPDSKLIFLLFEKSGITLNQSEITNILDDTKIVDLLNKYKKLDGRIKNIENQPLYLTFLKWRKINDLKEETQKVKNDKEWAKKYFDDEKQENYWANLKKNPVTNFILFWLYLESGRGPWGIKPSKLIAKSLGEEALYNQSVFQAYDLYNQKNPGILKVIEEAKSSGKTVIIKTSNPTWYQSLFQHKYSGRDTSNMVGVSMGQELRELLKKIGDYKQKKDSGELQKEREELARNFRRITGYQGQSFQLGEGENKYKPHRDMKRSYRQFSRQNHPDKGGNKQVMQEVAAIWNDLSDPQKDIREIKEAKEHFMKSWKINDEDIEYSGGEAFLNERLSNAEELFFDQYKLLFPDTKREFPKSPIITDNEFKKMGIEILDTGKSVVNMISDSGSKIKIGLLDKMHTVMNLRYSSPFVKNSIILDNGNYTTTNTESILNTFSILKKNQTTSVMGSIYGYGFQITDIIYTTSKSANILATFGGELNNLMKKYDPLRFPEASANQLLESGTKRSVFVDDEDKGITIEDVESGDNINTNSPKYLNQMVLITDPNHPDLSSQYRNIGEKASFKEGQGWTWNGQKLGPMQHVDKKTGKIGVYLPKRGGKKSKKNRKIRRKTVKRKTNKIGGKYIQRIENSLGIRKLKYKQKKKSQNPYRFCNKKSKKNKYKGGVKRNTQKSKGIPNKKTRKR